MMFPNMVQNTSKNFTEVLHKQKRNKKFYQKTSKTKPIKTHQTINQNPKNPNK